MRFGTVEGVLVVVHTSVDPSDEEWTSQCQTVEKHGAELSAVLVYSEGGGPSTKQRSQMRHALGERTAPLTAIMTSSTVVRGIITSLNWFLDNRLSAFEPSELNRALAYIGFAEPSPARDALVRCLNDRAQELGVKLRV